MDGELIAEAGPDTPSVLVEFQIPQDSLLEIKDEGSNSKIKFSGFEMVDCSGETKLKKSIASARICNFSAYLVRLLAVRGVG